VRRHGLSWFLIGLLTHLSTRTKPCASQHDKQFQPIVRCLARPTDTVAEANNGLQRHCLLDPTGLTHRDKRIPGCLWVIYRWCEATNFVIPAAFLSACCHLCRTRVWLEQQAPELCSDIVLHHNKLTYSNNLKRLGGQPPWPHVCRAWTNLGCFNEPLTAHCIQKILNTVRNDSLQALATWPLQFTGFEPFSYVAQEFASATCVKLQLKIAML
jgi:hypothetical protein